MTNGISAYRNAALQAAAAQSRVGDVSPRPADAMREAARTARPAEPSGPTDLSADERAMIDRYFPASAEMSMRIYGPGRQTSNLNPAALGSRLDLRG